MDIDGTLFSPEIGGTPASSLKAIELSKQAGHQVFLCTGRSLAGATKYLHYPVDGFIFGAGACVYAHGKRIYDHPLSKGQLSHLMISLQELSIPFMLEAAAGVYGDEQGFVHIVDYYSSYSKDEDLRNEITLANNLYTLDQFTPEEKVYKICTFVDDLAKLEPLKSRLEAPFVLTLSAQEPNRNRYIVEITNGKETKATGIEKVIEYLGLSQEDTVGIGDSANDIPMLDYCGISVAMGNGSKEAKEHADFVTKDILEDGIYHAFEKYQLLGE